LVFVSTPPDSSKPTWTVGFPALVREMEPPSRESAYLSKAEKNLHASRESRLVHLRNAVTRNAIDRATERLSDMAHPDRDYVVIRTPFIYGRHLLPNPPTPYMDGGADFATISPPLTRVLRRKNQHAIALYLTLLFVRQVHVFRAGNPAAAGPRRRKAVFNLDGSFSEASLIGLPSFDRRNQRRVFNRALDALEKAELVDLGRSGQRYATYTLNCEDGSGHAYTVPAGDPDVPQHLCLPTEFFTAGWPMILTPSEMATFLAICHYADRRLPRNPDGETPRRIYLAKSERDNHLGLSDEAYESIHQLAEFGLIDVHDPVEGRRRGRISPELTGGKRPDPYLLDPTVLGGFPSHERVFNLDAFKQPAIETAIDRLNQPLPRYAMWSGTSRKRDADAQNAE
jgi:hypothetical protein